MTMAVSTYLRAAAAALAVLQVAVAQQCYYPDGSKAADSEKPCSSAEGTACCPDTWECMENGLCYLPADKLYGRYSCTDKDWTSSGCPSNMCTYDMNAVGGEAITQCSNHDNKWCCDGDRTNVDCCEEEPEPRPFFALQDPVAYGTAGGKTGSSAPNLASITGKATGASDDDDSPSSTASSASASTTQDSSSSSSSSSSRNSASSTSASTPQTSLSTTIATGTAGPTTLVITVVAPAASTTSTASPASSSKSSNLGLIVGCAVGIPLGLALLGILTWLLRKRAHQSPAAPPSTSSTDAFHPATPYSPLPAKPAAATYEATDPGVPELAGGQGVGPERPVSLIPGKAEMDSGGGFAPGTVPAAAHLVGVGGGNSAAPPGYSHADPQAGTYQAYRPGVRDVPEMAELSAVTPAAGDEARGTEYPGMGTAR